MRGIALFLLMMFLGAPAALGEAAILSWLSPTIGGNEAVMVVDNGDDWSVKLNLRTEQSRDSKVKGRIFTGTRVEIYEDNGEWCTVGLNFEGGSILTGEVMKRYLSPLEAEVDALCPLAVAKKETEVRGNADDVIVAHLNPGDKAYVMAACGDRYFVMIPDIGQGYAPADAFGRLTEPQADQRIVYKTLTVPEGGVTFVDEYSQEEVWLAGGVQLEDCWQIPGDADWHATYGAGIQRLPRVKGRIPAEKLTSGREVPFEGDVYDWSKRFVAVVGEIGGEKILRGTDENGDLYWTIGTPPQEGVIIEGEPCEIKGEAGEILSREVMDKVLSYISEHNVLDERGLGGVVTAELAAACSMHASLVMQPGTGELLSVHVWLEDGEGSYVTGGDLGVQTGAIIRWGCNG